MGNLLVVLDPEKLSNPLTNLSILVPLAIRDGCAKTPGPTPPTAACICT